MKKFKFKLQSLLKHREFIEKNAQYELGMILKEIQETKDLIEKYHNEISDTYKMQEEYLAQGGQASSTHFVPQFLDGKKRQIESTENFLYSLEKKYQEKLSSLQKATSDVKIIEKLKEKDLKKYKKERDKKEQEVIDERALLKKILEK